MAAFLLNEGWWCISSLFRTIRFYTEKLIFFLLITNNYNLSADCKDQSPVVYTSTPLKDVYKGTPFKQDELLKYEVFFGGVFVGHSEMVVAAPVEYAGQWHRQFKIHAKTGDWYRYIFEGNDTALSYVYPEHYAASFFHLTQNEKKLFSKHFTLDKTIKFDHKKCEVFEQTEENKKKVEVSIYTLEPKASDALATFYQLRAASYKIGQIEKFLVYSSKKNWWLEAEPLKTEKIAVKAGSFSALKLKLQTRLGRDLQQKGDLYLWVAQDHPAFPIVKIDGKIKIGHVVMELAEFKPGT